MLRLRVYNKTFDAPDLKSALKREYLKAAFFVLSALLGFYTMFSTIGFDSDDLAKLVQTLSDQMLQSNFLTWMTLGGIVVGGAVFWFHFGSFIRWRGRSFWDQFADLHTNLVEDIDKAKSASE